MLRNKVYGWLIVGLTVLGSAASRAEAQVEAYAGEPFGVGRIVLRVPAQGVPGVLGLDAITLTEARGRTYYPAVEMPPDTALVRQILFESPLLKGGPVRREVGGIIQGFLDQTPPTTIYFLFKGTEPLDLTIGTRPPIRRTVRPLRSQEGLNRLAQEWWKQYTAGPTTFLGMKTSDYPPVVHGYLESMLSARLGFSLPPIKDKDPTQAMLEEQLGLMLGTERIQASMVRDRMLGEASLAETADLPPPVAEAWPPLAELQAAKNVDVEPIAMRVPQECFYVRFGNYANFLWMQDTMKRIGDDAGNLVSLRGLDYETTRRIEERLVVRQTALSRVLGGTLISDVAMIGTDLFLREGASFGLLFEARNAFLLDRELSVQRAARLKEGGVTEESVTIAGRKVSFLHSRDGTVRSFYLADNGYVLITSSKELMRQFIATGEKNRKPTGSLGATDEFRHARTVMPTSRGDTVFVYFSDVFFRNMAGPHYWIEMRRRLQATADIEVLQLARLAAESENVLVQKDDPLPKTLAALKTAKLLPENFGPRPDGSGTVVDKHGRLVDSLRGRRGSFVPIPDVPVEKITPSEAAAYRRFLDFYREKWGRLDPMIVGVRREDLGKGRDRITVDAQANPFEKKHYDMLLRRTGVAEPRKLAPVEGNLVDFQVVLPDQYLFAGLQDVQLPLFASDPNQDQRIRLTDTLVGYVGTTGELGILSLLQTLVAPVERVVPEQPSRQVPDRTSGRVPGRLLDRVLGQVPGQIPSQAPSREEETLPRLQKVDREPFQVFSFQGWLLEQVCPQLRFVESEPAQFRLEVGDVARAKITPILNRLSYARTRSTSLGNLRLLDSLEEQLRVPPDQCLTVAEELLDAKLRCPLGGKYELRQDDHGEPYWTSTSLKPLPPDLSPLATPAPADYVGPPLNWFRGLKLRATMTPQALSAHIELMMKLPRP